MLSKLMRLTVHILEASHIWEMWTRQEAIDPSRLAIIGQMHLLLQDPPRSFIGWQRLVSSAVSQKVHQLVLEFVVNPWLQATKS